MNHLQEISYDDACQTQGGTIFNRLLGGDILLVTGVSPILRVQENVRQLVESYGRLRDLSRVDRFFESPDLEDTECVAEVCKAFHHIRDSRLLSDMLAPFVQHIGGDDEILVDTGHFRCLFPDGLGALSEREDVADMFVPVRLHGEPEPFLNDNAIGGKPHRDIPHPHYTFQYNLWFPLHDIPSGAALLLFPELYRKPIDLYEKVDVSVPPGDWGYGAAVQPAMKVGDVLLFHSQHFHASPTEEPDLPRVTVEIRVTTGCHDDNSATYRRLFWNIRNFSPQDARLRDMAACRNREAAFLDATLSPGPDLAAEGCPQQCFNSLFLTPEASRMAGNLRSSNRFIRDLVRLSDAEWEAVTGFFRDADYVDDRSIALVRIFLLTGRRRLAEQFANLMFEKSGSYYFLMELGSLLGRFGYPALAITAYMAARDLATESKIEMDPYRIDVPTSLGSDIILPQTAVRFCDYVLNQVKNGDPAASSFNPFDYRIYNTGSEIGRFDDETGTFRLTLSFATLLILWRVEGGGRGDIVWCSELEDWMSADKVPAGIESEADMARELAKKYYQDLPTLIASLIQQNQQLTKENDNLKKALLND